MPSKGDNISNWEDLVADFPLLEAGGPTSRCNGVFSAVQHQQESTGEGMDDE